MALSKEAETLLKAVCEMGGWGVLADNIIAAADLLRAGYVRADDDYEGPRLYYTDKGLKAANRRKLIDVQ